jgi:hypothetical protein
MAGVDKRKRKFEARKPRRPRLPVPQKEKPDPKWPLPDDSPEVSLP